MKIAIVGDTHGNTDAFVKVIDKIGEAKVSHIFVVGDFGLWTHRLDGHVFLDAVQEAATRNKLSVFAVGGNHENWTHWDKFIEMAPTHKGMAYIRSRVLLAPKIHHFTMAHKQFVIAGGAVSVDRAWRQREENGYDDGIRVVKGKGRETLWWPDEELTDGQVREIRNNFPKADILLTHDCSNYTTFKNRIKPDPESERHRRRIDEVIRAVKPSIHFHGHMHDQYDWVNTLGTGMFGSEPEVQVQTYGLECDEDYNNWGILETDTLEFSFRGEAFKRLQL